MIAIVDYGMGNLGSIQNMLKRIGAAATITADLQVIGDSTKVILPGVGVFDCAMIRINNSGLRAVLDRKALIDCVPMLGICLGMQLLTRSSEEGELPGLGWIPATTIRFPDRSGLKVPHMGWNLVHRSTPNKMTEGFEEETRFYFVHSYYVKVEDEAHSMLKTEYGVKFDSAIQNGNIYGVQFHPEKSHRFGMRLLTNFAEL
jgi:imidazole glycerol-phosphate synthase subunit HisH